MKKMMMMILAALSAVTLAHAASITWNSGVMYKPGPDGKFLTGGANRVATTDVKAYLFLITQAVYDSINAPEDIYKVNVDAEGNKTYTGMFNGENHTFNGANYDGTGKPNAINRGTSIQTDGHTPETHVYAAVVYEYLKADELGGDPEVTHWLANKADVVVPSVGDGSMSNLGLYWNNSTTKFDGWTAVPEPVCAALLALGAAVLGLRRKRS